MFFCILFLAMNKVDEVKSFISNELKSLREQHKLLEVHISACEVVLETNKGNSERFCIEQAIVQEEFDPSELIQYIETQICRQQPPWELLQLLCLWSIVSNGIPTKYYSSFRTLFYQAYGYEHVNTLFYLNSAGLLFESGTSSMTRPSLSIPNYNTMAKHLHLTAKNSGGSYVFSDAYNPVVVRLLELLINDGWNSNALKKAFPDTNMLCSNSTQPKPDNRIKKAIMVCFIGGVTYAEIAALRRFAQDHNFRVITITSHIIDRQKLIKNYTDQ